MDPEQDFRRLVGIIDSMTPAERRNPTKYVDQSRRRRIAAGAGVEPHEVNELVKQFDVMAGMMKKMSTMGIRDRMKAMQQMGSSGMFNPGAKLATQKKGTGKRLTSEERAKLRRQKEKELRRKKREERGK
jgi:signal recognition particle subunit SRP54